MSSQRSNRNRMATSTDEEESDQSEPDQSVPPNQLQSQPLTVSNLRPRSRAHNGRAHSRRETLVDKRIRQWPNESFSNLHGMSCCQTCKKLVSHDTTTVKRHVGQEVVRRPSAASRGRSNNGEDHIEKLQIWNADRAAGKVPNCNDLKKDYVETAMLSNMTMTQTAKMSELFVRYEAPMSGSLPTTRQGLCLYVVCDV